MNGRHVQGQHLGLFLKQLFEPIEEVASLLPSPGLDATPQPAAAPLVRQLLAFDGARTRNDDRNSKTWGFGQNEHECLILFDLDSSSNLCFDQTPYM